MQIPPVRRSNFAFLFVTLAIFLFQALLSPVHATSLQGTFVSIADISSADLPAFLDDQKSLGQRTLIIMNTVSKKKSATPCQGTELVWANGTKEKLTEIMSFANSNQFEVYFGLVWSYPDCTNGGEYLSPNKEIVLNYLKDYFSPDNPISYIANTYGSHSSFAGWYISDEPALGAWTDNAALPGVFDYWKQYSQAIKAKSDKPIIVAAYMCGVDHYLTPEQLGERARLFDSITGIDIYAWQDCVNAQGLAIYGNNPDGRSTTGDYYRAISQAVGKSKTWADIEISNCCINPTGVRGGSYKAASFARVEQQLSNASEDYVDRRVSWINQFHLSQSTSNRWDGAARLYHSVRSTLPDATYELVIPTSYAWQTPPDQSYPDSGNEMFDGKVGESKAPDPAANIQLHEHYTGILGRAIITINLGKRYVVDYIAAHVINRDTLSIKFPSQMIISCSLDQQTWEIARTEPLTVESIDSEYMLGNNTKLNKTCQYLKLEFTNFSWTFLSEIEILGQKGGILLVPGDLNTDGTVDIFDYQKLIINFGNPYTIFDYQKIIANFGK